VKILHLANRHHDEPSVGHGHWLNMAFKDSCDANGIDFVIVSSAQGKDNKTLPLLRLNQAQRSRFAFFPLVGIRKDLKVLDELLRETSNANSVIHVYEGGLRELLLLILLHKLHPSHQAIFNFNLSDPWDTALSSTSKMSKFAWTALSRNIAWVRPAVLFTAETAELAELLEEKLGFTPLEYPFPALTSGSLVENLEKDFDFFVPIFGDKELELLNEALTNYRVKNSRAPKVMIQPRWSEPLSPELVLDVVQSHGVVLLETIASKTSYESAIQRSKVVVLPYLNTDYYKLQSSSRMIDAVALGARVIAPENTAIGRQLKSNRWGSTFRASSAISLSQALAESIEDSGSSPGKLVPRAAHESISELISSLGAQQSGALSPQQRPTITKMDLTIMSCLFLVSDFRSFIGGVIRVLGVKVSIQKRINSWLPRRRVS